MTKRMHVDSMLAPKNVGAIEHPAVPWQWDAKASVAGGTRKVSDIRSQVRDSMSNCTARDLHCYYATMGVWGCDPNEMGCGQARACTWGLGSEAGESAVLDTSHSTLRQRSAPGIEVCVRWKYSKPSFLDGSSFIAFQVVILRWVILQSIPSLHSQMGHLSKYSKSSFLDGSSFKVFQVASEKSLFFNSSHRTISGCASISI